MKYICECGKEFETPNSFNGHKSHCEIHLIKTGRLAQRKTELKQNYLKSRKSYYINKSDRDKKKQLKKLEEITNWVQEKHICQKCGKIMTNKWGKGIYCNAHCANSHIQTREVNQKRSLKLKGNYIENKHNILKKEEAKIKYYEKPNYCQLCGKVLPYEIRKRRTCSVDCKVKLLSEAGKKSSNINRDVKRSKNEIYFYELCLKKFKNIKHNEPLFNGWDADVIIEDYKIAVLWNGPWHYKQLFNNQNCSLKQIQNRDKIKIKEIKAKNYIPYIIKDEGQYNKEFVEKEFIKFINTLEK